MTTPQPGILAPVPTLSRYLEFGHVPGADVTPALRALAGRSIDETAVIGFGPGLLQGLGKPVESLRPFPNLN